MIISSATSVIVDHFEQQAAPCSEHILTRVRIAGSRPGPVFGTSSQQSTSFPIARIRPTGPPMPGKEIRRPESQRHNDLSVKAP